MYRLLDSALSVNHTSIRSSQAGILLAGSRSVIAVLEGRIGGRSWNKRSEGSSKGIPRERADDE